MTSPSCDAVRCAAASERDGEQSLLAAGIVEHHLASCEACRLALEDDAVIRDALRGYQRTTPSHVPVWAAVAQKMTEAPAPSPTRRHVRVPPPGGPGSWPVAASALAVVLLQALVLGPGVELGWLVRPLPLMAVAGLFVALRTNPLRLDTSLGTSASFGPTRAREAA